MCRKFRRLLTSSIRPLRQTFSRLHTTRTIVPHRALFRVAAPRDRAGRATSDSGEAPSLQETPPTAAHRLPQPEGTRNTLFSFGSSGTAPPDNEQSFRPARRAEKSRPAPHRQTVRKAKTAPPCAGRAERAAARIRNKPPPFINARPRSVRTPRNPPFPPQG